MKKFLSLFLVLAVLLTAVMAVSADDFKVGVILVHDENSGYDQAHIEGMQMAMERLGLDSDQVIFKYNIPESEVCQDTAEDLADQGCTLIISDSYGHQAYMMDAAKNWPDVHFIAATGDTAWKEEMTNVSNMFPHTFESRYVSGVVAGMKLKELMDNGTVTDPHIGYVGAYPYAEVVSGYTGFFLGIRSIVPEAYMDVQYTNSWYDPNAEAAAAEALIARGCVIIGQHADSTGAPSAIQAAQDKGAVVYSVGYNIDMRSVAPTAALTSAQNCWGELYTYMVGKAMNGEEMPKDFSIGYADDAVQISELGESCAEGTAEAVDAAIAAIKDGSLHVFDTSTFTMGGEPVTSWFALDTDGDWAPDSEEAIADGYFHESEVISAPYFSIRIDGITELTNMAFYVCDNPNNVPDADKAIIALDALNYQASDFNDDRPEFLTLYSDYQNPYPYCNIFYFMAPSIYSDTVYSANAISLPTLTFSAALNGLILDAYLALGAAIVAAGVVVARVKIKNKAAQKMAQAEAAWYEYQEYDGNDPAEQAKLWKAYKKKRFTYNMLAPLAGQSKIPMNLYDEGTSDSGGIVSTVRDMVSGEEPWTLEDIGYTITGSRVAPDPQE